MTFVYIILGIIAFILIGLPILSKLIVAMFESMADNIGVLIFLLIIIGIVLLILNKQQQY